MDFVNSSFVSLSDLDDIDTKINAISDQKTALTEKIAAKNSQPASAPSPQFSPEVLEVISEIAHLSPESTPQEISQLEKKYGSLAVFGRLRSLLEKRAALENQRSQLQYASTVEEEVDALTADSAIETFTSISERLNSVGEPEIQTQLREKVTAVAQSKKNTLAEALAEALSEIRWLSPKETVSIDSTKLSHITALFSSLVDLQAASGRPQYPESWWALQVLLQPFKLRFTYHFQEATKTNRLSKPEWALTYAETFLDETLSTLEMVVGDTFLKHNKIGVFEILTTVLEPVREKLLGMVSTINKNIANTEDEKAMDHNGRLLSHLIFETTSFDQRLRNAYKYNPYIENLKETPKRKWMGLTSDILVENDRESVAVNNWLNLELRLAKNRFETEILKPANAFEIDYNFSASSDSPDSVLKPSYSAYGLSQLFDNLTTHFKTISIVKIQLKYVSKIQLLFLDEYLSALKSQFKKFDESLSSKLLANLYSSSKDTKSTQTIVTNGLQGLETLTGIYCSTKYIIEKMEEWSEELVFVQLWDYCKDTSDGEASIFDSSIREYKQLFHTIVTKYEDFFRKETRAALRDYVNTSQWSIPASDKAVVSPKLSTFSSVIPVYMSHLKKSLPGIDYYIVSSKVCNSYSRILLEYVITNNQFTKAGLEQFQADLEYMDTSLYEYLLLDPSRPYNNCANKVRRKLLESVEVLNHFDAAEAKAWINRDRSLFGGVRSEFENELGSLSESEILDLLFRIV